MERYLEIAADVGIHSGGGGAKMLSSIRTGEVGLAILNEELEKSLGCLDVPAAYSRESIEAWWQRSSGVEKSCKS